MPWLAGSRGRRGRGAPKSSDPAGVAGRWKMSGSRWVAEFPIALVLESHRALIALARAVARTVAQATARLGNAARKAAAG